MTSSLESLIMAIESNTITLRSNRTNSPNSHRATESYIVRRKILKRRRAILEGSRRPRSRLEKRIRVLRKLVPVDRPVGLDGLFMDAADYIAWLRMQVEVMKVLVKVLSGDSDD